LISVVTAVIVLSFMIFIHELGHFLAAKKSGVGVEKFSIGFGPRLWGTRRGETEYLLSAIPFGGYVKMVGDNPDEEVEDKEKSFLLKPVWKRTFIVFAGPASNLLSAVAIMYMVYVAGVPAMLATVGTVNEGFPAAEAGMAPGDVIVAVDGEEVETWDDLTGHVHDSAGIEKEFSVRRGDETLVFSITPRPSASENIFGEEVSVGLIGITPGEDFTTVRFGPGEALGMSLKWTYGTIKLTVVIIGKIFRGVVPADNIGGPLMIMQAVGQSTERGLLDLLSLVAYISVALGFFNLLPIPVLDGGHLLFFFIEAVRGKPLGVKTREIMQQVGLVLLVALMLFATKNDIYRLFQK
jgi:regulator of sigma E protease